jgi:hypothetical protein
VHLRVIALLVAVVVAFGAALATVGSASPAVATSPDVAELVGDGALDLEPALAAPPVAVPVPVRRELRPGVAPPAEQSGRLYLALVFRPPRRFAP